MSDLLTASVAEIVERYKRETLEQSTPAAASKLVKSEHESVSSLQQNDWAVVEQLANIVDDERAKLQREATEIAELRKLANDSAEDRAQMAARLADLASALETEKMNRKKADSGVDELKVREMVNETFEEYRRATEDDVEQLKQLSKLATHDRGAFTRSNDVIDLIMHRVEAVEKENASYHALSEEQDVLFRSTCDQLWNELISVKSSVKTCMERFDAAVQQLHTEVNRNSAKENAKARAIWQATLRTFKSITNDAVERLTQQEVAMKRVQEAQLRFDGGYRLMQEATGRIGAEHFSAQANERNFKEQTNERLVEVLSRMNQLLKRVDALEYAVLKSETKQKAESAESERNEIVRSIFVEKSSFEPKAAIPTEKAQRASPGDSSAMSQSGEHFPYCTDTGRQESQRLQRFDVGPINQALRRDALTQPAQDLRCVLAEMQKYEVPTASGPQKLPSRSVEDILSQIERLERRAARKEIYEIENEDSADF